MKLQRWEATVGWAILATLTMLWVGVPVYWTVINSLKPPVETYAGTWLPWVQFQPTLRNWTDDLSDPSLRQALANSLLVASASTTLAMILGSPAGYALARFRYRKWTNSDILVFFLAQRVLPPIVVVIPLLLMAKTFRLVDTPWMLIGVHTAFNLPLVVLITRNAFADLPVELEEAAVVDGCHPMGCLVRISVPLAAPALSAAAVVAFSFSWNEFVAALVLTLARAQTIPRFVAGAETTWGLDMGRVAVRGLLAVGPPIVLGLFAQRFMVRGLTLGAVKG